MFQKKGQQAYSVKGQIINILGFVYHTVYVETTHLCHCSSKVAIDTTKVNEHMPVLIQNFIYKNTCQFADHSLPTPPLELGCLQSSLTSSGTGCKILYKLLKFSKPHTTYEEHEIMHVSGFFFFFYCCWLTINSQKVLATVTKLMFQLCIYSPDNKFCP